MRLFATLEQVRTALSKIEDLGCVESFEDTSGTFSAGGVEGRFSYDLREQELTIDIDEKPLFASDSMIEEKVREFFKN